MTLRGFVLAVMGAALSYALWLTTVRLTMTNYVWFSLGVGALVTVGSWLGGASGWMAGGCCAGLTILPGLLINLQFYQGAIPVGFVTGEDLLSFGVPAALAFYYGRRGRL